MRFVRSLSRHDDFSELNTFECRQCGFTLTAESALTALEMAQGEDRDAQPIVQGQSAG
jgi:hypothetical protein